MAFTEPLLRWLLSSADLTAVLVTALIFLLTWLVAKALVTAFRLPPGPFGMPVFGIMPYIKTHFHLFLTDLSKQYGKVFTICMGMQKMVVLADHEAIKRAFQRKDLTHRPKSELLSILGGYGKKRVKEFIDHRN